MVSSTPKSRTLIVFAICVAAAARVACAAPGNIYNLGTLFEGTYAEAFSINNAGQVVGMSQIHIGGTYGPQAFRYDGIPGSGGVMRNLGSFTTLDSASATGLNSINNSGQVCGYAGGVGFRYTGTPGAGGVMESLGGISANSINDAGQIGGVYSPNFTDGYPHALRYTGSPGAGGVVENLGTLGGWISSGDAINNAGQVVGYSNTIGNGVDHAFLYTGTPGTGGVMSDLGTLGGINSGAKAVNNAGQVTGYSEVTNAVDPPVHAFLYTGTPGADGAMIDLGTRGGTYSFGWGINDAGFVVGQSFTAADGETAAATLWLNNSSHTAIGLQDWLNITNPSQAAHWMLWQAYDINNNGLITGTGYYDDGPGGLDDGMRGYILDASALVGVPEPATLTLIALGLPILMWRRSRRSTTPMAVCLCSGRSAKNKRSFP